MIFNRLEDVDQQPTDFSKYEKDFNAIGVALKDVQTDSLVPLGTVLDETAAKWDSLNSIQKDL